MSTATEKGTEIIIEEPEYVVSFSRYHTEKWEGPGNDP
jgi:hypothetical protein